MHVFTWALAAIRSIFSLLASHGEGGADGVEVDSVRRRFSGVQTSFMQMLDFLLAPSDNRLLSPAIFLA